MAVRLSCAPKAATRWLHKGTGLGGFSECKLTLTVEVVRYSWQHIREAQRFLGLIQQTFPWKRGESFSNELKQEARSVIILGRYFWESDPIKWWRRQFEHLIKLWTIHVEIYFLPITVFAADFIQVLSFQGGLIFMEGVVSHGVHDLSSIEVYQHHDEHTQTNAHKDVWVPNAHSAPPCSIHNCIWKSRPRVVLYVASSKSEVLEWFFFCYTPKGLFKGQRYWVYLQ